MKKLLAFDFGASTGRAILGEYENGKLSYKEIHRFDNTPIEKDGHLRWDFDSLMNNVYIALEKAGKVDSIGFDTWGVDFGLIDKDGKLIEFPIHYRDSRTKNTIAKATKSLSLQQIYEKTGNQIMPINTLFQLIETDLSKVDKILFMPDLFAYHLCGKMVCERTISSTSQMLNPKTKELSDDILKEYNIPRSIFAQQVQSGTIIGEYKGAKVVSVAGHDTQSAVSVIPESEKDSVFLSCGTWSLFGCELNEPILTQESRELDLSNEIGVNNKINYLKNITGLWLIQESRRQWKREGLNYSYSELEEMALNSKPMQCFIDTDNELFSTPGDLPQRIKDYCAKTGQYVPKTVGEVTRCIYESLALKYKDTLNKIKNITNKNFEILHILGGGCQAKLLCQMTADAMGIEVKAGPVEATALGNILLQLKAIGEIENLSDGQNMIFDMENISTYKPQNKEMWEKAQKAYSLVCG